MDAITAAVTIKALDGLTDRSIVTAQNIANANTPGYRPLRVTFEGALIGASNKGLGAIRGVTSKVEAVTETDGRPADLRLDLELATASETAMRYAALIEVLNREMQIDGLAVSRSS